jgi:transposase InsO family protein
MAVDIATGWHECVPIWGKGKERVGGGVNQVQRRLPFPLRELHTDNGGEFINDALYPYCQRYGIRFTRGRPYKKNDQAYVEQKNWSVVRRLVGYHRYSTKAAYEQMERLYLLVRQYANFFQPIAKLVHKERVGAKVIKRYDVAKTPYQRLLEAGILEEAKRCALEKEYQNLNPVHLRSQIDAALEKLWKLAQSEQPIKPQTTKSLGNTLSEATS